MLCYNEEDGKLIQVMFNEEDGKLIRVMFNEEMVKYHTLAYILV